MVAAATVTVLYRTNPHLDARIDAFECAELIVRTMRGEISPVQALVTPPARGWLTHQMSELYGQLP
jgi:microcystin degradation protein MlrC